MVSYDEGHASQRVLSIPLNSLQYKGKTSSLLWFQSQENTRSKVIPVAMFLIGPESRLFVKSMSIPKMKICHKI